MQIEELVERISLPQTAREQLKKQIISDEEYHLWKEIFYQDTEKFLKMWDGRLDKYVWALEFYVRIAAEVYKKYQEKQILDEVFDQTFYDITIWCEECYRKYGIYGLEEAGWIAVSVKMNLFRLGRLQFEPMILKEDMVGEKETINAGTPVLNVHIPAGEALNYEACLDSFRQAEEFFGKKDQIYVCDSWILSPKLREVLPEESNIIRFQKLFEVTKVHYLFRQAEQRIFGEILEDKGKYPENTLLQKNAKKYVLSGYDLGIGNGFINNIYKYV